MDVGYLCVNFVFIGLSVLDLGPTYATDRQTDVRQTDVREHHRLMPAPIRGGGMITSKVKNQVFNVSFFISKFIHCFIHLIYSAN